ncbi:hypothetical protein [Streptomyces montanisoli]|uniref:hypothetical protein n=1 Tax=Streptomyces montanisoli TaxID=2798581 RepID=UPI001FD7279D|nr:hypothetical protein [Streptomyces montanisoli]
MAALARIPAAAPAAAAAAGGLVGGFAVARWTKKRQLGGAVLLAAGTAAAWQWRQASGTKAAAGLGAAYLAAFGGSHPLAKKMGAWPSVFSVAGGMAAASYAVTRR